jgi:hypothetical protein
MTEAERLLREIVRAYTEGDPDGLEVLIAEAGRFLADLREEGEPTAEGGSASARAGSLPAPVEIARVDTDGRAFVALYNAAKRIVDQGPNASTMAELEAAVQAASRFV